MMKMKLNKKIAGASAMLMLSATMLGTSTFAWFTMSRNVKVGGMSVKTKVSGNLLISDTNQGDQYYGTELTQSIKALLEPVSTATAANGSFYYTVDAKADGSKLHNPTGSGSEFKLYNESTTQSDTKAKKDAYDSTFNSTYSITPTTEDYGKAYGYVDYVFYLKAVSDDVNKTINMTRCNISYKGNAITTSGTPAEGVNIDRAWRVAVLAQETAANTQPTTIGDLKGSILSLPNASNHNSGSWVSGPSSYGTASYNSAAVKIADLGDNQTKYYKVVVRLWLEGQDKTCTSTTYAALKDDWNLDLEFKLVPSNTSTEGETAVSQLTSQAKATVIDNVPRP